MLKIKGGVRLYQVITAPEKIDIVGPSFFLVGPIQNAPDWQAEAIPLLLPYGNVLNPRRSGGTEQLDLSLADRIDQYQWEIVGQEKADVIVIWLANADNPESQRMIGRDSRTELGMHIGAKRRMAIGIEEGFPGEKWLIHLCMWHHYPVWATLEATCREAIRHLKIQ